MMERSLLHVVYADYSVYFSPLLLYEQAMSKEPQVPHCCEEDPGFVFVLWRTVTGATAVHASLGLPSVGNLNPPLQQGRRIAIEGSSVTKNLMVCFMLPGATPEQSDTNLYAWLDSVLRYSSGS